jgi:ectoine hydroxylase-related dioxygenase (phytanoyl-CoA dioxygenase family)
VHTIDSGYAIEPAILSNAECDALTDALSDASVQRSRAGARGLMSNPAIAALATDARLIAVARKFLGKDATPFRATLFEKSTRTNWLIPWHQDRALPLTSSFDAPGWGPWSEKVGALHAHAPAWALSRVVALRVHLDASTAGNGPLRVIPGSHTAGVLTDDGILDHVSKNAPIQCLAVRGGVVAMRPLLIHSSSKVKSADPRRVLHIEYTGSLDLGPGIRLAIV